MIFLFYTISEVYTRWEEVSSDTLYDIYGFETSEILISAVTDKIILQIKEWQNRPLSEVFPVVYTLTPSAVLSAPFLRI